MVEVMIREKLLSRLDRAALSNAHQIDPRFRGLFYDPDGRYCVPYTYGVTGIAYNGEKVHEPIDSWRSLWDERYGGQS